ncbi:hypothetical protein BMS3Abin02_01009 [bacterium BMS3Abin02]|nr:hypothetical protein BMS3Abin02_01009 [bacterium BMS3Abin02]GBE20962.1 hypothetical protein BMS3Bbin01_00303 [bacterium BMS3Bbin01]
MTEFTGSWVVFAYSLVYGFITIYAISLVVRFRSVSKRFKRGN